MKTNFRIKCKKCKHEADADKFIYSAEGYAVRGEYFASVDIECPKCEFREELQIEI